MVIHLSLFFFSPQNPNSPSNLFEIHACNITTFRCLAPNLVQTFAQIKKPIFGIQPNLHDIDAAC